MKKQIGIIVAGFLVISIIMYIYFVFLYTPTQRAYRPINAYGFRNTIWVGYFILRFALCACFGWKLASYNYKQQKIDVYNFSSSFIGHTWKAFLLIFVIYFVNTAESIATAQWKIGESMAAQFMYESFISFFSQFCIAIIYLSYKIRVALCSIDKY